MSPVCACRSLGLLGEQLTFLYELIILLFYHLIFLLHLITPLCSTPPFTLWLVRCSNSVLDGRFISAVATVPEPRGARNKCVCPLGTSVYPSVWSSNTAPQLTMHKFSLSWVKMFFSCTSIQTLRIIIHGQIPSRTTDPQEQCASKQTLKNNVPQLQYKPSRTTFLSLNTNPQEQRFSTQTNKKNVPQCQASGTVYF